MAKAKTAKTPEAPTAPAADAPFDPDQLLAELDAVEAGQKPAVEAVAEAPKEDPKVIKEGDPEGRQPGNADDPIDLPPEIAAAANPQPTIGVMMGGVDVAARVADDVVAAMENQPKTGGFPLAPNPYSGAPAPEPAPPPAPAVAPAPPAPSANVSSATAAEMGAGSAELVRHAAHPTSQAEQAAGMPATISEKTRAELEAGRAALASRRPVQ